MATTETKRIPAVSVEIDGNVLVLSFANGTQSAISATELSEEIRAQAMMHGLKQKLVDAAAISRDPETGRSVSVEDKIRAIQDVRDRLVAGEWNKRRESGEGSGNGGLLFRALCELYPKKSAESLREYIGGLSKEQQAALRASSKVAPVIDRLRAKSASKHDADEMLAALDD